MSIYNEVKFGKEAQDEIYEGAKIVANAVASTLGPNGRTSIIEGFNGMNYTITKDGVSVAKAVSKLKNQYQNIGANLMKNIASETAKVGDGTTSSNVLGLSMLENGRKYLASGVKVSDLKKGIDCATKLAIEKIKAEIPMNEYIEKMIDFIQTSKRGVLLKSHKSGHESLED